MKRIAALALPVLVAAGCTTSSGGLDAAAGLRSAAETITASDIYDRIAFLADDDLLGRNTPSPGLDTAAQWIADEMASFGVEPAGEDGWLQRYPYPSVGLDTDETRLQVAGGATHSFTYGRDYYAQAGAPVRDAVGVVYVGRTLEEELPAARDRAVVARLAGTPEQRRGTWRLDGEARAEARRTIARAGDAGAHAVVFVLDSGVTEEDIGVLARSGEEPSRVVGGEANDEAPPPAFFIRHDAALRMFRMAELDGETLLSRRALDGPVELPGVTVLAAAPHRRIDDARPPNVVGVIRGSDPELQETYVVVSAHMDHVGVGRPDESGDSIYNGADDDASGTAVLVEVAEALASMERKPRRSILFVAVSGEEKGLLGSRWFVDHPTVPLGSMIANVNIDMVGRNAPDSIVVIGQEYSSLGPRVREIATATPELGLTVSEDLWPEERFFFRSDHFNFAREEIPALFFFAGTHEDYHGPGDEVDKIDTEKVARVGRLVLLLIHGIADDGMRPEWDPEGLDTVRELTSR